MANRGNIIDPWYITGFTDGEGCFSLFLNSENRKRKNGTISEYTYWITVFRVQLREDDFEVLQKFKEYFECGSLGKYKSTKVNQAGSATFHVKSRIDLINHIVPHFDQFQLQAKKSISYNLWREAVQILRNSDLRRKNKFSQQDLTTEENNRLLQIKTTMANSQSPGHKYIALNSVERKSRGKKVIFL